jgi:hypothetical protein
VGPIPVKPASKGFTWCKNQCSFFLVILSSYLLDTHQVSWEKMTVGITFFKMPAGILHSVRLPATTLKKAHWFLNVYPLY